MKTFIFRGTPVTCARDVEDLFSAARQDLSLDKVRIGSDMLINAALYNVLRQNWIKIIPYIAAETSVRLGGHSLGADHALVAPSFIPRSVVPHVFAFAPFQCANSAFWSGTYGGRPVPRIYGRTKDFAPGHNHLDRSTSQAGAIQHLLGGGKVKTVSVWPLVDESIEDHGVNLYSADLALVEGAGEAHVMCQLSAAAYITDAADMTEKMSDIGFRALDVIEAPGFRCVVLEEI